MRFSFFVLIMLIAFTACVRKNRNADVLDPDLLSMDYMLADTTKTPEVHFPTYFDSTHVLIQPIGFINKEDRGIKISSRVLSKSEGNDDMPLYAYTNGDVISGSITNIYFDDVENGIRHLLTNQIFNIITIEFLRELSKVTEKDYLLYTIYDQDSNKDGKLDHKDIPACYISFLNGTGFKKISPDNQFYVSGVWALWCRRYYFNSVEDVNRNGLLDAKDRTYYYYVDFSIEPYEVVEYSPLGTV